LGEINRGRRLHALVAETASRCPSRFGNVDTKAAPTSQAALLQRGLATYLPGRPSVVRPPRNWREYLVVGLGALMLLLFGLALVWALLD
jgi:hypothetical protein